jgi:quercetin dioxygenase-like cupin family protein
MATPLDDEAATNMFNWQNGASRRSVLLAGAAMTTLPLTRAWGARSGGEGMEIKRSGSQPSVKGPADWFTGTVRIDPLFDAPAPARAASASVTFEPGARTAWHTHPLGQTLIVLAGAGRAQRWGGPIEELRPGDVVWIAPGEKHWHGAGPTTAMTHIAIQEKLDGKPVDWLEHVTAQQYETMR